MSLDTTVPRSRRALLAAALGAAAATVASALGRPAPVRAGTDGDVVLGGANESARTTFIRNTGTNVAVLKAECAFGDGLVGETGADSKSGVYGNTTHDNGFGVFGRHTPTEATGSLGATEFGEGTGVRGVCSDGIGVLGKGSTGVKGVGTTALEGYCGGEGIGVVGYAPMEGGTAVRAVSQFGTALDVAGKAKFSRSGRATVTSGRYYVDVDLKAKGGLSGTPLCFANLTSYRSGTYVVAVRPNYPSSGKLRIYLNKAVASSTYVAWLVLS